MSWVASAIQIGPHDSPSTQPPNGASNLRDSIILRKRSPQGAPSETAKIDGDWDLTLEQAKGKLAQFIKLRDYYKQLWEQNGSEEYKNKYWRFVEWVKELQNHVDSVSSVKDITKEDAANISKEYEQGINSGELDQEIQNIGRVAQAAMDAVVKSDGQSENWSQGAWNQATFAAWNKERQRLIAVYNARRKELEPLAESIKRLASQIRVAEEYLEA